MINIFRDPRWGRNQVKDDRFKGFTFLYYVACFFFQETYGEDPWLSGHLGTAFVTGIQGGT